MKKGLILSVIIVVLVMAGAFLCFNYFDGEDSISGVSGFRVKTLILKQTIKQGESSSFQISIENFNNEKKFNLYFENLKDLAYAGQSSFVLGAGESKETELFFEDSLDREPNLYVGKFIVEAGDEKKEIPVILGIESQEVLFFPNMDIAPKYKQVSPGESVVAEIKVSNLVDTKDHQAEVVFFVKNLDDESLIYESEMKNIKTEIVFSKTIVLPEDISHGDYVLGVIVKEGDSVSFARDLFIVSDKEEIRESFFGADSFTLIFSGVVILILLVIVALVIHLVYERDKLFLELSKQQRDEREFYLCKLADRKKKKLESVGGKEKGIVEKEFKAIKKNVVKSLSRKYKEKKKILRKLKKGKRKNAVEGKLKEWKNQGFNVSELDKISKMTRNEMKDKMGSWKAKGYDTSVLK